MAGESTAQGARAFAGRKFPTVTIGKDGVFSFNTGGTAKDTAARSPPSGSRQADCLKLEYSFSLTELRYSGR